MNKLTMKSCVLVLISCLAVAACFIYSPFSQSHARTMQKNNPVIERISVKLGEDGAGFAARYPQYLRTNKQPAGVNFYSIDVDGKKKILAVRLEHGKYSIELDNALSVMGMQDMELKDGIESFSIQAGITPADEIMHDDARKAIMALLKNIKQVGWTVEITRGTARLRGKQALEGCIRNYDPLWLDGDYEPTLEEWMQLRDMSGWRFYADKAFLEITFMRDQEKLNPSNPGAYLLSMNIQSAEAYYRLHIEDENKRANWRQWWPVEESKLQRLRKEAEDKARAAGLYVDTTYQDPPLPLPSKP